MREIRKIQYDFQIEALCIASIDISIACKMYQLKFKHR